MTAALTALRLVPLHERIQLVEELWDTVVAEQAEVPLSDEQLSELDSRRAEMAANPSIGIPWEQVKASLRAAQA